MKVDYLFGLNLDRMKHLSKGKIEKLCKKSDIFCCAMPEYLHFLPYQIRYYKTLLEKGIRFIPSFCMNAIDDKGITYFFIVYIFNKPGKQFMEKLCLFEKKYMNSLLPFAEELQQHAIQIDQDRLSKLSKPISLFTIGKMLLSHDANIFTGIFDQYFVGKYSLEPIISIIERIGQLKLKIYRTMFPTIDQLMELKQYEDFQIVLSPIGIDNASILRVCKNYSLDLVLLSKIRMQDKAFTHSLSKNKIKILPTSFYLGEDFNRKKAEGVEIDLFMDTQYTFI